MTQIVQHRPIGRASLGSPDSDRPQEFTASKESSRLNYSQCIPRELVHRSSISEVFITDIRASKKDSFALAYQWPRGHSFYRDSRASIDSAMLVESIRQATIALAHSSYGVPYDQSFLMTAMHADVVQTEPLTETGPLEAYAECQIIDMTRRPNGEPRSFATQMRFYRDGTLVGSGRGEAQLVNKSTYLRLRKHAPVTEIHSTVPRLQTSEIGHDWHSNSILASTNVANEWTLELDTSHPVFFDHLVDHVPGVVLLEAIRQGVRVFTRAPTGDAVSIQAKFHQIVDLDRTATVMVKNSNDEGPRSPNVYTGLIIQNGTVAAECNLTFNGRSV